jgi:mono/diheme cytochrome c family protein
MLRSALVLILLSATALPALAQPAAVARGQRLAESVCAKCHAIGRKGDSPAQGAPRFRDLTALNNGRSIDEIFAKGVLVLHPGMPSLAMSDREQDDLLAYLRSLQPTAAS